MRKIFFGAVFIALSSLTACGSAMGGAGNLLVEKAQTKRVSLPSPSPASAFTENWTELPQNVPWNDATTHGNWFDQWGGYGTVEVVTSGSGAELSLSPKAATIPNDTDSALVTSIPTFSNFTANATEATVAQLRTGSAPNPWEVAWFLWNYTDNTHFYYIALKPNGWELGKEDPAYSGAQRYLATAATPTFPIGKPYAIQVSQSGATMTVSVNGSKLVSFTDKQRPYLSGSLGLYCEDSHVIFGSIAVSE